MSNKNKVSVRIANVKCSDGKKLRKYFSKVLTKKNLGTRARIHIDASETNPLVILKDSTTSTKGEKFVITTLDDCETVSGKIISTSCEKNRSKISKAFDTVLHFDSTENLKKFVGDNNIKKCASDVEGLKEDIKNCIEKLESRLNPSTPSSGTPVKDARFKIVGIPGCTNFEKLKWIFGVAKQQGSEIVVFKETILNNQNNRSTNLYTILLSTQYAFYQKQRSKSLVATANGGEYDVDENQLLDLLNLYNITPYEDAEKLKEHVNDYVQKHPEK